MIVFENVRKSEETYFEKYSFGVELALGGSVWGIGGVKYDRTGSGKAMETFPKPKRAIKKSKNCRKFKHRSGFWETFIRQKKAPLRTHRQHV